MVLYGADQEDYHMIEPEIRRSLSKVSDIISMGLWDKHKRYILKHPTKYVCSSCSSSPRL